MTTAEHPITRTELREEIGMLRDELREHFATKKDLSDLETRVVREMTNHFRWLVGIQVAVIAVVIALLRFLPS